MERLPKFIYAIAKTKTDNIVNLEQRYYLNRDVARDLYNRLPDKMRSEHKIVRSKISYSTFEKYTTYATTLTAPDEGE